MNSSAAITATWSGISLDYLEGCAEKGESGFSFSGRGRLCELVGFFYLGLLSGFVVFWGFFLISFFGGGWFWCVMRFEFCGVRFCFVFYFHSVVPTM